MKGYYEAIKRIGDLLLTDPLINTVSKGSLDKIALMKHDMYPLAHVMINSGVISGKMTTYNVSIIYMDLVEVSKEEMRTIYEGNDNEDDVLHQTLEMAIHGYQALNRGVVHDTYQIVCEGDASFDFFVDRFADKVAGCTMTLDITMAHYGTIC